ncbi:MAG: ATP-binding protein [Candidatus Thorarchaeota archaeon]
MKMDFIEDKFRKLEPVEGNKIDRLWNYYIVSDKDEKKELEILLDILLNRRLNKSYKQRILLKPPEKNKCIGEYKLGIVLYPDKPYAIFGLREDEWIKHILITGMTGTGKTNTVFQILKNLKEKNKPFLVSDWKKTYRNIIQLKEFEDSIIFTIGEETAPFHFNPLIPPEHINPKRWMAKLIDIIGNAYFTGQGVEYLLREAIEFLYKKFNVFHNPKEYPTFKDVEEYILNKKTRGRMSLWHASALRTLASLTFTGGLGNVVNIRKKKPLNKLLSKDVILELDSLSNADKVFLTESLIYWIYEYRKNEGRRESFKHALIIEEAHHVLSHKKEAREGQETIMETMIRQIREFGESVIIIDQEPSKLSSSIKANTYTKITFNLANGQDIFDISKAVNLNKEEIDYLDKLETGHAIVKLKGRCFEPFLVVFPKIDIKKGLITDEILKMKLKGSPIRVRRWS